MAERNRIQSVIEKAQRYGLTIIYPATFLVSLALSMLSKLTYSVPFSLIHITFCTN